MTAITSYERDKFIEMNKDIGALKDDVHEIKQGQLEMNKSLSEILTALKGDNLGSSNGMIDDIKNLKTEIETLKDFKKRVYWTLGLVATPIMFIVNYLMDKLVR